LGFPLLAAGIAILGIAGLYEGLRGRVRTDARTNPTGSNILASGFEKSAIYVVVGFGYALRTVAGMWIGGQGAVGVAVLLSTAVSMSAFGTMFVAMTWVIVGTSFVEPLRATPAFPTRCCAWSLIDKSHYGPLLASAGLLKAPLTLVARVTGATGERPFLNTQTRKLDATWNKAFLTGAAAASVLGMLLARGSGRPVFALVALALAVGGAGAAGVVLAGPKPPWRAVLSWIGAVVLLMTVAGLTHQSFWWVDPIPYAVVCIVYMFFCWSRAVDLVKWSEWPMLVYRLATTKLSAALEGSVKVMLGPTAVTILREETHTGRHLTHQRTQGVS
jgi:hypothetical protein